MASFLHFSSLGAPNGISYICDVKVNFKKVIIWVIGLFLFLLVTVSLTVFFYKDNIIRHFIAEANKQLITPVHIDKIDVSPLRRFPLVAITLHGVQIEGNQPGSNKPLLKADRIHCYFNPIKLMRKDYTLQHLSIQGGTLNIRIDKEGNPNYKIWKEDDTSETPQLDFNLKGAGIDQLEVLLINEKDGYEAGLMAKRMNLTIQSKDGIYDFQVLASIITRGLKKDDKIYFDEKELRLESAFTWRSVPNDLDFLNSNLRVNQAEFTYYGSYRNKADDLKFFVEGSRTSIQNFLAVLPEETSKYWKGYESEGEAYFDLEIKGPIKADKGPGVTFNFGLNNATISHADYASRLESVTLKGLLETPDLYKMEKASLTLSEISGQLENKSFKGELSLTNLKDPRAKGRLDGSFDLETLMKFYPGKALQQATGSIRVNALFEGRIGDLKHKNTASKVKTSGEMELLNVGFQAEKIALPMQNLNGNLLFNNNDLALSNVSGTLGSSDFLLNGFFKNIFTWILFDDQPLGIEADLISKKIELNELLSMGGTAGTSNYQLNISPLIYIDFNCKIAGLKFRRFTGNDIQGKLQVNNQVARVSGMKLKTMGGSMTLTGQADDRKDGRIEVISEIQLDGIYLDSIFYIFEDFNQDFLHHKHLKGQAQANINLRLNFDQNLKVDAGSINSAIDLIIKNGQLNNFEPMQNLSKYLDPEGLENLRFAELQNEILIKDQIIMLPEMEVKSNVTNILISGTHTFDQKINYRVVAPLIRRKKPNKDEAFGAVEDDGVGPPKIHLKITGSTSDYLVAYDKERVKEKIAKDIKTEIQDLKEAFKTKGKKEKEERVLQEEDFFDWDEDGT